MGIDKREGPEVDPKQEETKGKVLEVIKTSQKILRTKLQVDDLMLDYNFSKTEGPEWAAGCFLGKGGKTWAIVFTGYPPYPDAKFLQEPPSDESLDNLGHEITHILINDRVTAFSKQKRLIQKIVDEGIAMRVETELACSHQPTESTLTINQIGQHCRRITQNNQDLLLSLDHDEGHDVLEKLKLDGKMQYDGFKMNRTLAHIAGMGFVEAAMGNEKIWKWPVFFDNPPSMDEIIDPEKYRARVAPWLADFKTPDIEPILPELGPSQSTTRVI